MNKEYTINQIEKAFHRLNLKTADGRCIESDILIAELTKSKWTPQVGEVYAYHQANISGWQWKYNDRRDTDSTASFTDIKRRPLLPDEVPALKVAIEAMQWSSNNLCGASNIAAQYHLDKALAKISELIGEDMK